jgi:hypothetical protein
VRFSRRAQQRRDAEDEGKRRHQDPTQPLPRRLDRGSEAVEATVLELLREDVALL